MATVTSLAQHRAQPAQDALDADHDRRSSSLSELGDHIENEAIDNSSREKSEDGEADDTEAETERLEDSPYKERKHQNVLLATANSVNPAHTSPSAMPISSDQLQPTSDISSLDGSSDDETPRLTSLSPPRKRKRLSSDEDHSIRGQSPTSKILNKSPSTGSLSPVVTPIDERSPSEEALIADNPTERDDIHAGDVANKEQKRKTGARKARKSPTRDLAEAPEAPASLEDTGLTTANGDAVSSNGEDGEGDDGVDVDVENAGKSEEGVLKKRSALDSLTALEKCFATLRDKLFDERLASANEELSLLQQPGFKHPELLAMKEAVDQHCNQKIAYEQKLLKYKLQALQKASVATKHQIHSQYMQTASIIRERSLEQLNEELYQVQRERRSCEGDIPDYMFAFTPQRPQQILQQSAYNHEVSVLSGVAKYVGFPAAPMVRQARSDELEDDMRSMGIEIHPVQTSQSRAASNRPNVPASAAFQRHTPIVEDGFLERNAWANPQHPAHQQQRQQMHRQISQLSHAATPASTPGVPKGAADLPKPHGSGSTLPENLSGPGSSMAPTPATGEPRPIFASTRHKYSSNGNTDATPSRVTGPVPEATPTNTENRDSPLSRPQSPNMRKTTRPESPSASHNPPFRDTSTPNAPPKPSPFPPTTAARASPVKLPVKVEDVAQMASRSPVPHHFTSPAPAVAAGNGQLR